MFAHHGDMGGRLRHLAVVDLIHMELIGYLTVHGYGVFNVSEDIMIGYICSIGVDTVIYEHSIDSSVAIATESTALSFLTVAMKVLRKSNVILMTDR